MKKILLTLLIIPLLLSSCSKDDEKTTDLLCVISIDGSRATKSAWVRLYKEKITDFDFKKSMETMDYDSNSNMMSKSGKVLKPIYIADNTNNFDPIEQGKYTLIVIQLAEYYPVTTNNFYAYKEVNAQDYSKTIAIDFKDNERGSFTKK